MADAGTAEPAKPAEPEPLPLSGIPRDKIVDAATGKPLKGKILRPVQWIFSIGFHSLQLFPPLEFTKHILNYVQNMNMRI
jgi:hypothetical protein